MPIHWTEPLQNKPRNLTIQTKSLPIYLEIKVIYVGIDVHKMFLQVAAMDEKGEVLLNQRVGADHVSVAKFFDQFPITKTRCVRDIVCLVWIVHVHDREIGIKCSSV